MKKPAQATSRRQSSSDDDNAPRYEQVKRQLRHDIESGVLLPGQMLPNQAELTAKYGVSTITVRRALEDLARSGVLQRVAGVGTFVRASRSPPNVALILLGFDEVEKWHGRSKIFSDLLAGIGEIAWDSWSMFSVFRARNQEEARAFVAKQSDIGQLDGVIFKSRDGRDLPDVVRAISVPSVAVHTMGPEPINCVVGDEFGEAQMLTRHLIDRGYRRIGFIGPPVADLFERRYGGYVASLRAADIPLDHDLVVQAEDYDFEHASLWIDRLLARAGRPDAIFCGMGTRVASRMIAELAKRGIRVAQDIGFVMHDPDDSGELFQPPVTSAGASNFDLGRAAAQLLNSILKFPQAGVSHVVLPAHVVIRASTPGKAAAPKAAEASESGHAVQENQLAGRQGTEPQSQPKAARVGSKGSRASLEHGGLQPASANAARRRGSA